MAYGDKYEFSFYSQKRNDYYVITLARDGYTGTKKSLEKASGQPLIINWFGDENDTFKPIIGSEAVIRFVAFSSYEFQEFFLIGDRDYKVTITRNGDTYWSGYVIPGIYNEEYSSDFYTVEIAATDALGDLYNIDFVDPATEKPYTSTATVASYIENILNDYIGLGLTFKENLDIYHSTHTSTSTDSFYLQTYLSGHAFKDLTYGSFLEYILRSLNSRLFQVWGSWHLDKIDLLTTPYYNLRTYNSSFASPVASSFNPLIVLEGDGDIYPINNTGDVTIREGAGTIRMNHNYGNADTVLVGDNFSSDDIADTDEVDRWISNYAGSPALWTGFSNWNGKATIDTTSNANDGLPIIKINGDGDESYTISAMANHASGTQITATGHTYSNGDVVYIISDDKDTDFYIDYGGFWTVSNVATNTFVISATYTSDRSSNLTRVRNFQNCSIIQYNGNLPLGMDSVISRESGDYIELKIQYYIRRQNLPVQSESLYSQLVLLLGLDNQDGGSDLYASNIAKTTTANRANPRDIITTYKEIKEFDAFFTTSEATPIVIPTNNVESGTFEEVTVKIALNIDSTDTYKPYLAIAQGYGDDYDLGNNGVRIRSVSLTLKNEFSGPGVIDYPTDYVNQETVKDVAINVGAVDPSNNLEWKAKRIWLNSSDTPLANNSSNWEDSSITTDTFAELIAEAYIISYNAGAIRLRVPINQNQNSIEIYNSIRDTFTFGRKFQIVELIKDIEDDTCNVALVEIRPRDNPLRTILRNDTLQNKVQLAYFPAYFIGPTINIEAFVNVSPNNQQTNNDDAFVTGAGDGLPLSIDANGIPYVNVTGDPDEVYGVSKTFYSAAKPVWVFIAIKVKETPASEKIVLNTNDGTTTTSLVKVNSSGDIYLDAGGTAADTTGNITVDELQIWSIKFSGTVSTSEFWINDTNLSSTLNPGLDNFNGLTLLGDNPTSGGDNLAHHWYGTWVYQKNTLTERSDIVELIRKKTQADRIAISALSVSATDYETLNITFDKSVTGFNTTGLTLNFRSGTTRTISSVAGSGTAWTIKMNGPVQYGDKFELVINAINGATNTAGDYIYPGSYPVTNTAVQQWDLSSFSNLIDDYSPYAITLNAGNIDAFTGTTAANIAGVDKLTVALDSSGYRYCQITRGDDQAYTANIGTQTIPHAMFFVLELDSTDATTAGYIADSQASANRAAVWRATDNTKAYAGTTYTSAMVAQEDQVITIGVVFDGSSSSFYLNGSITDSEVNFGTHNMGTGLTLFDHYNQLSSSATFKWYRTVVFSSGLGESDFMNLHNKAKAMYKGLITV